MRDHLFHIAIVGGGITGLAAAHYLEQISAQRGARVRYSLLEAGDRLGGKILTHHIDGYCVEGGPDCFLTRKPWALELCRELGLEGELIGTNSETQGVYVLDNGRLIPLPEGVMLIVPTEFMPFATSPLFSIRGKLRMAMDLVIPPRSEDGDESLANFVRRRLGQEALDKIAEPLLSGIHVSDPERLSLKSTFPRLQKAEQRSGSLIRAMLSAKRRSAAMGSSRNELPMFMTLREGMQTLPDAISKRLDPTCIHTNTRAISIHPDRRQRGTYQIELQSGPPMSVDGVILTTPASVSRDLLEKLDPVLASQLNQIEFLSTALVVSGFAPHSDLPELDGYGFLIPRTEGRGINACSWPSSKFAHRAPPGHQLYRTFVGGPGREHMAEMGTQALKELVSEELGEIMGIKKEPEFTQVIRWIKAHPQYSVGHLEWLEGVRSRSRHHPRLYLAGSSYGGVGVPDCVRQAKAAVEQLFNDIAGDESIRLRQEVKSEIQAN